MEAEREILGGLRPSRGRFPVLALTLFVVLGIVVPGGWAVAAESDTVDVRAGVGLRLDINLPRKWELDLNYRHKMVDDLSTHRGSYFTLKVERRLEDWITAIGAYRRLMTDEGNANRFAAGVELDTRLGSLKASFRPLIQYRTAILEDDEVGGDGKTFVRTRLRLEYPLTRRLDVYACVEPFFGFDGEYPIDNWRNELGLQIEVTKWLRVEPYYIYRPDYGKSYNRLYHVLGLELRFKVKVRR